MKMSGAERESRGEDGGGGGGGGQTACCGLSSITGRDTQVPCGAASVIKNGCCVREFD